MIEDCEVTISWTLALVMLIIIMMLSKKDDNNCHHENINAPVPVADILDSIGIEVYKFLHPKDLLSFSLVNRHVHEEVSKGLIQSCLRQLPPNFGSQGVDHSISIHCRHSFPSRENLLDHFLDKIRVAELKVIGKQDTTNMTMGDSLVVARNLLSNRDRAGAKFVSYNSSLPPHLREEYTSAGYHYERNNKNLAASRADYILSRLDIVERKTTGMSKQQLDIAKSWIDYILSQKHIVAGTWFWSCRHRNLDFQGVEGKGVMISSPNAEGEEMEICWTRLTASRV